MALMKTAHDEGCNFSAHYIDLLSKFNSYIESQKRKIAVIDAKFNRVFETHPAFLDKRQALFSREQFLTSFHRR